MNKTVLIFPAGMPRSLEYLEKCLQSGQEVVGSSSLAYDPSKEKYPRWVYLPYVTDPGFDDAFFSAIAEFDIIEVYTPNFVAWDYLDKILKQRNHAVRLVNKPPVEEMLGGYRSAITKAKFFYENPLSVASDAPLRESLPLLELAALWRYADIIPGMCDDEKIRALFEVARCAVDGDIVEIGSWWGKSAFVLAAIARYHGVGKLLCVDPWKNENLVQNEKVVDKGSSLVDAEEALTIFKMGIFPFNANHVNYLHMVSGDAAPYYRTNKVIKTDVFGETEYAGKISILHIDGNHAYDAVKTDIDSWGGSVVKGGWIIFDDYIWPYGDGPKKVADEYFEFNKARISTAFVMGTALFLQLSR